MKTDQEFSCARLGSYDMLKIDRRLACIIALINDTFQKAPAGKIASVLDLGCDFGFVLRHLPSNLRRLGVDVSSLALESLQSAGIETLRCDFDNNPLPVESGSFDLILANDVIEHVLHTDHVLNEINRVLRPGGVLIASIPNVNQPVSFILQHILDLTPMFSARYRSLHYRDFSNRLFTKILEIHGFDVLSQQGTYIFPFENNRASHLIAKMIPRWGAQILYLAKKRTDKCIAEEFCLNMPILMRWIKSQQT